MEGSRRGKGSREKGLPTPDPHVDGENGVKNHSIQYEEREKGGHTEKDWRKKKEKEKEHKGWRNTIAKRKNLVLSVIVLGHIRGYFLYMYEYNSFLLTL